MKIFSKSAVEHRKLRIRRSTYRSVESITWLWSFIFCLVERHQVKCLINQMCFTDGKVIVVTGIMNRLGNPGGSTA